MKWFKRRLRNWLNSEEDCYAVETIPAGRNRISLSEMDSPSVNFKVMKANGGIIVESSRYDRQRDRHETGLHIIQDNEDLGEALSKIVTFENLKL